MSIKSDITPDEIVERIQAREGDTFKTKRGLPFTYTLTVRGIKISRTNIEVSFHSLKRAAAQTPLANTMDVAWCRGSSYIYGILMDRRIREFDY